MQWWPTLCQLTLANDKGGVTNDHSEHSVRYELPLTDFNTGDLRLVASLVDQETGSNIASIGFNDELLVKITNPDASLTGLIRNKGKLSIKKLK